MQLTAGERIRVSGYADELGIADYGSVRIACDGIVAETPRKYAKKVLVTLDDIAGDGNVTVLMFKRKVLK